MGDPIAAVRAHHQTLLDHLRLLAEAFILRRPEADPQALLTFLQQELLPHAIAEEQVLYPAVEPLLRARGGATTTMSLDHLAIREYVGQLSQLVQALTAAPTAEQRARLQDQVRDLVLQVTALVQVHLRKEEEVYLPTLEEYLSLADQRALLDRLHAAASATGGVLDVRSLAPAQRHALIFQTFAALAPGQAFILINDHDPKPLYYQFQAEYAGQFTWEYLVQGPETWQVRIGRRAGPANPSGG